MPILPVHPTFGNLLARSLYLKGDHNSAYHIVEQLVDAESFGNDCEVLLTAAEVSTTKQIVLYTHTQLL